MSLIDAIMATTKNSASALDLGRSIGALEEGKQLI